MNNPIVHTLYQMFQSRGFSVLRFNFRGVGRSQGIFENGAGDDPIRRLIVGGTRSPRCRMT